MLRRSFLESGSKYIYCDVSSTIQTTFLWVRSTVAHDNCLCSLYGSRYSKIQTKFSILESCRLVLTLLELLVQL